jgi:hypothetical protein
MAAALVIASSAFAVAGGPDSSAKAEQKLAEALVGRTAGPAVSCIQNLRGRSSMEVIDDSTLLFRDGGVVYVQKPKGSCAPISRGHYALVTRKSGSTRYCEGDAGQLIDQTTGIYGGSCIFGPFVPYRKGS